MAKLILTSGDTRQEFELGPINTVGRHPDNTIQILDRSGTLRASYNININAIGAALAPTWSPDGHWFAYSGPNGLTVASMDGLPPYSIDASGEFPVWRP